MRSMVWWQPELVSLIAVAVGFPGWCGYVILWLAVEELGQLGLLENILAKSR